MAKRIAATLALALLVLGCGALPDPVRLLGGPFQEPVSILTSPQPECFAADVAGLLVVDPTYGTAIVDNHLPSMLWLSDVPVTVAWPPGFSARRSGSEVEVLDPQGNVVGTTGRSYSFLGGFVAPGGSSGVVWPELTKGVLLSCGNLKLAEPAPPSPPPTQDQIRKFAARDYAEKVIQANRARNKVFQRYQNITSLNDWKTYCWKLAYVERDFLNAVGYLRYPDDTGADARALIRDEAAQIAALRTCAKAPNVSALNRAMDLANKARDRAHEASRLVRLDLGLNSLPG